jgi:enoyl-CoA hydratase
MRERDVRFRIEKGVGWITLDRPKALNALTLSMIREIDPRLRAWADDPDIREVVITGAGERAFCAGGDVRSLHENQADDETYAEKFFGEEYTLNQLIKRYSKPYIAILDGITMGGGVGLSVHGSHRVATDRTVFAMPEMAIGFFPDVGGGYVLSRLADRIGYYLALSGGRTKSADSVYTGDATHYVGGKTLADFCAAIGDAPIDELLGRYASDPGPAPLADIKDEIARCFSANTVEDMLVALDDEGAAWAEKAAAAMRRVSPTSLKVAKEQLDRAADLDFEDAMIMEYRMSQHFMTQHDFREGVRAVLVDKDNAPDWQPKRLEDVTARMVEAYFAPLGARDLKF